MFLSVTEVSFEGLFDIEKLFKVNDCAGFVQAGKAPSVFCESAELYYDRMEYCVRRDQRKFNASNTNICASCED